MSRTIVAILSLLMLGVLSACAASERPTGDAPAGEASQELIVFAAASLGDAFQEMATVFESRHPGTQVIFNFAGSSQLAAQLAEGAPADVFASANESQMQAAIAAGHIEPESARLFAGNTLTIIVPADNPADITALEDLSRPGILLVLAVEGVPVRQYTDEVVARLGPSFGEGFYDNVVSEEDNVRQVLAKVALGEADAGLVYTSDVTSDVAEQLRQIPIPEAQNAIAAYPIALLVDAPSGELARAFVDFVLSQEGQAILARWGFSPPPGS